MRAALALGLCALAACGAEEAPAAAASAAPAASRPSHAAASPAARSATDAAAPWFSDVTEASGLVFVHDAGFTPEKHLPETMGAGAALFDADGDGDLDLYLVQSGPMPGPGPEPGTFVPAAGHPLTNELWLNDGRGHFANATSASGAAAHAGYGQGCVAGDVDLDGDVDLFVTNLGPDALLLNDGAGYFEDATQRSPGLAGNAWTGAALFFDADADGDLDLFVVGYVGVDLAHPDWCGGREEGWRSFCHPDQYEGLADELWLNRGDGSFALATEAAGLSDAEGKGLGALAADFDEDGDLDVYVANDSVENRMWNNLGGGRFEDATLLSATGVDRNGATEAGMGLAVADVDLDADQDILVTNFDNESNTLYRNDGAGLFSDETIAFGLEAPSRLPVGFGVVFADFDEDGDPDLAVANGHIIDNIQLYHDGKTHAQRAQLFENVGGRFAERQASCGDLCAEPWVGRGLYSGDLDGDGDPDLLLTQNGRPARLFQNERGSGKSLWIRGLPNGARVVLELAGGGRRTAQAVAQTSYYGQCAAELHFGLGAAKAERLRVARLGEASEVVLSFDPPIDTGRVRAELAGGELALELER